MKRNVFFVLVGLALAFTSCEEKKEYHCYTPMGLSEYFPYSVGDTLRFASEDGDTIEYKIYKERKGFDRDPHLSLCLTYTISYQGKEGSDPNLGMYVSVLEDSTSTQRFGKAWSGEVQFCIAMYDVGELEHWGHAKFDEQSNMVSADFSDTVTVATSWGQLSPDDTITIVKGVGIVSFRFVDNSITERNNKTYTLVQ